MKTFFLIALFAFTITEVCSQQEYMNIQFDNSGYLNYVIIDTLSNPNNIWQVGEPNKVSFTEAYTLPNAIVTDTLLPYPNNDTSTFFIKYLPELYPAWWQSTSLQITYRIDTDFENDFGFIEFSPDNGQTWVNYMTDSIYNSCYGISDLYYTGYTENWDWSGYTNDPDCFNMNWSDPDTVIYKFTFISDDVQTIEKDGWMIDNIKLYDIFENIEDNTKIARVTIFPNPSKSKVFISSESVSIINEVRVYNQSGQLVMKTEMVDNSFTVTGLQSGLYVLKIRTDKGDIREKLIIDD